MNLIEALADLLMVVHAAYALFVVGGLVLVIAGLLFGWRWTRNRWFAGLHLAAVLIVVGRVWAGWPCPFSAAEDRLRANPSADCWLGKSFHEGCHRLAFRGESPHGFAAAATFIGIVTVLAFAANRPLNLKLKPDVVHETESRSVSS